MNEKIEFGNVCVKDLFLTKISRIIQKIIIEDKIKESILIDCIEMDDKAFEQIALRLIKFLGIER